MPTVQVAALRAGPRAPSRLADSLIAAADDFFTWQWPWNRRSAAHRIRLGPREKLHPLLEQWLVDSLQTEQQLLVTFIDTIPMPSFAGLDSAHVRARIEHLVTRRRAAFARDTLGFGVLFGARPLGSHWLTQTLLLRVPMTRLAALAARPAVMFVRPRRAGEGPPWTGPDETDTDDIAVGVDLLKTEPYLMPNLVPTVQRSPPVLRPWISLLDTGIRADHEMLTGDVTLRLGDCVDGGSDCHTALGATAQQDACSNGHGTSTAAILDGTGPAPDRRFGIAHKPLDSYRVYVPGPGTCGLQVYADAAERGFEAALERLDRFGGATGRIIVAEIAANEPMWGQLSREADHAYDLGRQVLAATGDGGAVGTVRAPANGCKTIGVGGFNIVTGRSLSAESLGPTDDGRIKPDIQAPSAAEAAGNQGPDDYQDFGGTSGAVPFAAGASALLAGWWASFGVDLDPGMLNALLIVSGQKAPPFDNTPEGPIGTSDHVHGAGHIVLPNPLSVRVGRYFLTESDAGTETIDIPLSRVPSSLARLDAALWWADSLADQNGAVVHLHSRVELALVDPDGIVAASCALPTSVFQRCSVASPQTGAWTLRLIGHEMRDQLLPGGGNVRGQRIYWAVGWKTP